MYALKFILEFNGKKHAHYVYWLDNIYIFLLKMKNNYSKSKNTCIAYLIELFSTSIFKVIINLIWACSYDIL